MYDDDKSTYKVDTKFNYDDGILEINIPEILAQLDDEDKEAVARLHAFESAIWEEIKRCLRDGVSSANYNSYIHKLRIELLSGDGADKILKATVRGLLFDLNSAKRGEKFYRDNYWQLRRWCMNNFTPEQRSEMPKEIEREESAHIRNKDIEDVIAKAKEK